MNINKLILTIIFLATIVCFNACKNSDKEVTENKIKKLEEYRSELNALKRKITELEKELEGDKSSSADHSTGVPPKNVTTQKVKPTSFTHNVKVFGNVHSRENVLINSEVSANVDEILVRDGAWVKKGQVLIRLNADIIKNNISEIETALSLANDVYQRRKNLWDQKIGSEIQYLQAKNEKERLEKSLQSARSQYKKTKISAPINGFIDEIFIKRGELANPGQAVARVVNLDKVSVKANISERYIGKINVGDTVNVQFPILDKSIKAKVSNIGNIIHPGNRTFGIEVQLTEKDTRLKPNLLASVVFSDYHKENAIVIPVNIVQHDRGGEFVYIVEKNSENTFAKRQLIKTGLTYEGKTEVREGLEAGNEIIILGYSEVSNGTPIIIQK